MVYSYALEHNQESARRDRMYRIADTHTYDSENEKRFLGRVSAARAAAGLEAWSADEIAELLRYRSAILERAARRLRPA